MKEIHFTIHGKLASMKNRRIPSKHNPYVTHVNKDCRMFGNEFAVQLPRTAQLSLGSPSQMLGACITVYYPSMRADLDCAYVYDLLEKHGVVANDRYIRQKCETARIDKKNPRVEIEVFEL